MNQTDYQGLIHALKSKFRESKESLSFIESVVRGINSAIQNINPSSPPLKKNKSFKELAETYVRNEADRFSIRKVAKTVFYEYLGPRIFGKYFRYISLLNFWDTPIPYEKVAISLLKKIHVPDIFHRKAPQPDSAPHYDESS